VLIGQTGDAAQEEFRKLFDGDYSMDKLAAAMNALGGIAEDCGTNIQYAKLQILTTLAIAAAELIAALAAEPETLGASTLLIPGIEALTMAAIRDILQAVIERIATKVASALTETMVNRLARQVAIAAIQEA
jgi:hypothetical protein